MRTMSGAGNAGGGSSEAGSAAANAPADATLAAAGVRQPRAVAVGKRPKTSVNVLKSPVKPMGAMNGWWLGADDDNSFVKKSGTDSPSARSQRSAQPARLSAHRGSGRRSATATGRARSTKHVTWGPMHGPWHAEPQDRRKVRMTTPSGRRARGIAYGRPGAPLLPSLTRTAGNGVGRKLVVAYETFLGEGEDDTQPALPVTPIAADGAHGGERRGSVRASARLASARSRPATSAPSSRSRASRSAVESRPQTSHSRSRRASTVSHLSEYTVRNGTGVNMPSFKKQPPGYPSTELYSMPMFPYTSKYQPPGKVQHLNYDHRLRQELGHVFAQKQLSQTWADKYVRAASMCCAIRFPAYPYCCSANRTRAARLAKTMTSSQQAEARAPKFTHVLMDYGPQDDSLWTTSYSEDLSAENSIFAQDPDDPTRAASFRRPKGLCSDFMSRCVIGQVAIHATGHGV